MEEEKKKKKKRRIFLLIWFLLVTLLFSTATYAWFSSNRMTDIEFFDVHVETDGGIEISANAIDWKSVLSLSDINDAYLTYANNTNQVPAAMKPMSTAGITDGNGYLYMYRGSLENNSEGDYILSAKRETETRCNGEECDGNFISFDIFIRSSAPHQIYLQNSSYVTYVGEKSLGIENSARVGFVVEGNVPLDTGINTVQNLNGGDDDDVYIWEPNYDVHTPSGIENALLYFYVDTTETNAARIPYDGLINPILMSKKVKMQEANSNYYSGLFKPVNIKVATKRANEQNEELFYLNAGITKIKVYMWLEGQDVDSENHASFGDIQYYVQFTLNP